MWCSRFDFGLIQARWRPGKRCHQLGVTVITAAPTITNITIMSRSPRVERLCRVPSPAFI
jgi:hypothetical protein